MHLFAALVYPFELVVVFNWNDYTRWVEYTSAWGGGGNYNKYDPEKKRKKCFIFERLCRAAYTRHLLVTVYKENRMNNPKKSLIHNSQSWAIIICVRAYTSVHKRLTVPAEGFLLNGVCGAPPPWPHPRPQMTSVNNHLTHCRRNDDRTRNRRRPIRAVCIRKTQKF